MSVPQGIIVTAAQQSQRPKLNPETRRFHKKLRIIAGVTVFAAILAWMVGADVLISLLLSAGGMVCLARAIYIPGKAKLPDPIGAPAYRIADPPRAEFRQEATNTKELPVKTVKGSGLDDVVFRNHMLDYFRKSKKLWFFVVPAFVFALLPVILVGIDNRQVVLGILVIFALLGGLLTMAGFVTPRNMIKRGLAWPFKKVRRLSMAVTAGCIACFFALLLPPLLPWIVFGLLLVALLPIIRRWAVWNSRRYIITATQYTIKTKALWIFWITNGEKTIDLSIVRLTSHDTPPYALAVRAGETAGWVSVETNLQEDDPFSKNPNLIKNYLEMEDIINARREQIQTRRKGSVG